LWARIVLGLGLVPVVVLGPFIVIGLWPGLNFDCFIIEPGPQEFGLGISRTTSYYRQESQLYVAAHFASVEWMRLFYDNIRIARGWGWDRVEEGGRWEADRWRVSINWKRF
jgi:hypothetical protein